MLRRRPGKAFLALLLALGLGLVVEGVASVGLAWREARDRVAAMRENPYSAFDPELGWVHRASFHAPHLFGPGLAFTTNALGARGGRELARERPAGRRRALVLGDSFTAGHGVGDGDAWPARLEARCPGLEAVNFGVGGYGVDQAVLLHRRVSERLEHDLVILAVIRDDFWRTGKADLQGTPRPLLIEEGGALRTVNLPLAPPEPRLGRVFLAALGRSLALTRLKRAYLREASGAAWTPPFEPSGESFTRLVGPLLAELKADALRHGAEVRLVFLPDLHDLRHAGSRRFAEWLAARVEEAAIPFVDLTEDLRPLGAEAFLPDGHYTRRGYDRVAERVARWLGCAAGEAP